MEAVVLIILIGFVLWPIYMVVDRLHWVGLGIICATFVVAFIWHLRKVYHNASNSR